jgi:hypothetical protein
MVATPSEGGTMERAPLIDDGSGKKSGRYAGGAFSMAPAVLLLGVLGIAAVKLGGGGGLNGRSAADSATATQAATATRALSLTAPFPFDAASPKFAVAGVDPDGNPLTLPWQPLCLGDGAAGAAEGRAGVGAGKEAAVGLDVVVGMAADETTPQQQQQPPPQQQQPTRQPLGVISGDGLHCNLRGTPWLLSRVNRGIPTAVFSARGSGAEASAYSTGSDAWLKGVLDADGAQDADDDANTVEQRVVRRLGYKVWRL